MSAYPHLFSPLQIGNVTVRNRIMQTAHVKLFAARRASTRSATSTTRPRARRAAPAS